MAINLLSPRIYNRIAAGEVVERPASVVKELVENSLDAGATQIRVEIAEGGIKKISVSDNGCGISKEDLPLAFLPHATSKISNLEDLDEIATLGFRGEALASIASVSMVSLTTKTKGEETGHRIEANGGEISKISEVARLDGTTITVDNLFYNTPARAKFLKKPKSEEGEVTHLFEKFMMAHPEVDFCYVVDGKEIYNHSSGTLDEVIYLIYGREVFDNLLKLDFQDEDIKVNGYVVSPKMTRPNRTYQTLFVNVRYVENYMVSACVQGVFERMIMKGRFPIYVIKLEMPFDKVDVNVHPNKKEVKFENSSRVFGVIRRAVEKALVSSNLIADFEYSEKEEKEWSKFSIKGDENLAQTGFNAIQDRKYEKLRDGEGASYVVSVDDDSMKEKILSPKDYQKKGIDIINMPNFSSVKSDAESKKNRKGGNIFFDHSGDSLLHEVEISVQKDEEDAQKLAENSKEAETTQADVFGEVWQENGQEFAKRTPNFVEEKFLKVGADEIKIVGVVFRTYIITEFDDSIYVIDQHAMHERQNYDKLKAQIENHNVAKQDLLLPYEINLLSKDREKMENALDNLHQIGFEIQQNGGNFKVTSVPFVLSGIDMNKFLQEILQEDVIGEKTASGLINEKLCQSACKHSIRAGDNISKDEIMFLIDKIKDGVPLCPHGRPIIVKITRKELEKMFKRTL